MTRIGTEMAMSLKTQNGLIGELFVKFVDTNKQNRKGSRWFEDGEIDSCSGNLLIELLRIIKD